MKVKSLVVVAGLSAVSLSQPPAHSHAKPPEKAPGKAASPGKATRPAPANASPAGVKDGKKTASIRKLLELTGSAQIGAQVFNQIIGSMKSSMPNVPERFWRELTQEARTQELINLVIPIYDRHLSQGELDDIIQFYETPSGKKLVAVLPAITQESMDVGQIWGKEIVERVTKKLKEKGYSTR
jgi:hypothetical protein